MPDQSEVTPTTTACRCLLEPGTVHSPICPGNTDQPTTTAALPLPEYGQQISEHSDPPMVSPGLPGPPPDTSATRPERLACGCDWITKYCDEHHYEIRQRAHDARVRRAIAERLRRQPWANALAIADAIERDEWDV